MLMAIDFLSFVQHLIKILSTTSSQDVLMPGLTLGKGCHLLRQVHRSSSSWRLQQGCLFQLAFFGLVGLFWWFYFESFICSRLINKYLSSVSNATVLT